jgi:hypothetical protein
MLRIVAKIQDFILNMQNQAVAPIFNAEFNRFQKINATEAWSLFFSASNKNQLLGSDKKTGNYFTFMLFGGVIAYAIETIIFRSF